MTMLNCDNCGHKWDYLGKAVYYTSCPSCNLRVKSPNYDDLLVEPVIPSIPNFKKIVIVDEKKVVLSKMDRLINEALER